MSQFDPRNDPTSEPAMQPSDDNGSGAGLPNLSIAALPSYPVLDLRILPEPVANDEFADAIPVLTDLVVAGTTGVREILPEDALRPANRPEPGRDLDSLDKATLAVERPRTGDSHYSADAGIDLSLDQSLIEEFVTTVEQGVNRSVEQLLTQRLAQVATTVTAELREEIRTLVRGYVDTYLPELLADDAADPAPEQG